MSKSFEQSETQGTGFGERLRREREMRGISLDEVAAATKIGTRLLRALEEEQFDRLPGGIFNKGYVRAYARYVGIDEEQALADYLKAASETPPDVNLIAHQSASARDVDVWQGTSAGNHRAGFPLIPVLVLVVVIVGAVGGWKLYQERQRERRQPPAVKNSQDVIAGQPAAAQTTSSSSSGNSALGQTVSAPAASPSGNASVVQAPPNSTGSANTPVHSVEAAESLPHPSGTDAASASTGTAGAEGAAPFEVIVRAKDRAWVSIKSDGKVLVRGVIKPPEVKTIHATNEVVFWTGNAGEVEISFNGKNVPLTGGENDEQVLVFNSHGLLPRTATQ